MSDDLKIKTLMTIDDSALDQMLYKRIMNRSGIVENVITFQLAADALAYLKSTERDEIDAILLDVNMPHMSGFEFLQQATNDLGADFSKCVVIMLTTSLDPEDEERAKKFQAVKAYLNKPLTIEGLKSVAELITEFLDK